MIRSHVIFFFPPSIFFGKSVLDSSEIYEMARKKYMRSVYFTGKYYSVVVAHHINSVALDLIEQKKVILFISADKIIKIMSCFLNLNFPVVFTWQHFSIFRIMYKNWKVLAKSTSPLNGCKWDGCQKVPYY